MLIKNQATKSFLPSYSYNNNNSNDNKMQLRSLTRTRNGRVSMMTTTSLVLLLALLLVDTAASARKLPKRPAKPLKTFPRNNATPTIAAVGAAAAATNAAEGAQPASGSELPKPLTPHASEQQPAEAAVAEPSATPVNGESKIDDLSATAAPLGSQIDEDCEPDMIGFELITG